ncbi:valyl-tRNA synthetase modifier [Escherichia phage vB_EcoM_ESCO47]|nr:valyl-tRNA synthetase modifier [Escherichia phage vB_EcoM_ESCO47]
MTKILLLLVSIASFAANAVTKYAEVVEYTNRTSSDYCGKNKACQVDFAQKLLYAYKDGEKDGMSPYKSETLIKRYNKKWQVLECSAAAPKDKALCDSMVDRLVDSYTRGLTSCD